MIITCNNLDDRGRGDQLIIRFHKLGKSCCALDGHFYLGRRFSLISCSARVLMLSKILKKAQKGQSLLPGEQIMTLCCRTVVINKCKKSFVCCVNWFPCAALFLVFKSKVFSYLARRVVPRKNGANIVERNLKCSIINLVIWMKLVETLWVLSFSWILAFTSVKIAACMFLLLPVGHQSFSANRQFSAYRVALLLKHRILSKGRSPEKK